MLDSWRKTVEELREIITADEDADKLLPNYGDKIDRMPIPEYRIETFPSGSRIG